MEEKACIRLRALIRLIARSPTILRLGIHIIKSSVLVDHLSPRVRSDATKILISHIAEFVNLGQLKHCLKLSFCIEKPKD
jgi:hypothetical protein